MVMNSLLIQFTEIGLFFSRKSTTNWSKNSVSFKTIYFFFEVRKLSFAKMRASFFLCLIAFIDFFNCLLTVFDNHQNCEIFKLSCTIRELINGSKDWSAYIC